MATEGKLYFNDDNGSVYLALDGTLRHVPDPRTFSNLFTIALDPSRMNRIKTANLASLNVGRPLVSDAQLIWGPEKVKVFFVDTNASGGLIKRHVSSPQKMEQYSFNWNNIRVRTAQEIASFPDGPAI